jgi:hypothetical protein
MKFHSESREISISERGITQYYNGFTGKEGSGVCGEGGGGMRYYQKFCRCVPVNNQNGEEKDECKNFQKIMPQMQNRL